MCLRSLQRGDWQPTVLHDQLLPHLAALVAEGVDGQLWPEADLLWNRQALMCPGLQNV